MTEALVFALLLGPTVGGLLAWGQAGRSAERLALAGMGIASPAATALAVQALVGDAGGRPHAFGDLVAVDALGAGLLLLTAVVAGLAVLGAPRYVRHELTAGAFRPRDEGRFYALFLWFATSLFAVPLLDNLGLLWVAIEATTIVSALLVGITRTPDAIEAAWKYLILGTVGVGFALLGTLLAYASSVRVLGESSDALDWTRLVSIAPSLDPGLLRLAFVFALAGYGTKIGLVPFHTWLPDAHSQAPSPVSALLSGVSLTAAAYALVRFHLVATAGLGPAFSSDLLVGIGLLTMAVALPFLVVQEDLKRLLAYSSIEHMGLVILGIGFGGPLATLGAVLHVGLHGLVKATLFLAGGELVQHYGTRRMARIRGALIGAPVAGPVLGAGILLIGGLPPSGMFVTEFAIVVGGVARGYTLAAALAAVALALGSVALVFHGARVLRGEPSAGRADRPFRGILRLGLPLALVGVLGLWTPGPVAAALDAVRMVMRATGG